MLYFWWGCRGNMTLITIGSERYDMYFRGRRGEGGVGGIVLGWGMECAAGFFTLWLCHSWVCLIFSPTLVVWGPVEFHTWSNYYPQLIGLDKCLSVVSSMIEDAKHAAGIDIHTPLKSLVRSPCAFAFSTLEANRYAVKMYLQCIASS